MTGSIQIWLVIAGILILIDVVMAWGVYVSRIRGDLRRELSRDQRRRLIGILSTKADRTEEKLDSGTYLAMKRTFQFGAEWEQRIERHLPLDRWEQKLIRGLNNPKPAKKAEAVFALGRLGTEKARLALEAQLLKEDQFTFKLYIANALSDIGHGDSLPVLIRSLNQASRFYRSRVNMLITEFGQTFHELLPKLKGSQKEEIRELLVDFASVYDSGETRQYLIDVVESYLNGEEDERGDQQGPSTFWEAQGGRKRFPPGSAAAAPGGSC